MKCLLPRVFYLFIPAVLFVGSALAQTASISGRVQSGEKPLPFSSVKLEGKPSGLTADSAGSFTINRLLPGTYVINVSMAGYKPERKTIILSADEEKLVDFNLSATRSELTEVVVTGT